MAVCLCVCRYTCYILLTEFAASALLPKHYYYLLNSSKRVPLVTTRNPGPLPQTILPGTGKAQGDGSLSGSCALGSRRAQHVQ